MWKRERYNSPLEYMFSTTKYFIIGEESVERSEDTNNIKSNIFMTMVVSRLPVTNGGAPR
jgi:hypothetical protein